MDCKAQVSLEFLLIFFISLIILSVISIPLTYDTINTVNDIKSSTEVKNTLVELSNNVNIVYSSGYGSKKTISVNVPSKMNIYYKSVNKKHYLYSYVILSDNTKKEVSTQVPCKVSFNGKSSYYYTSLKKGWYYDTEIKWIYSSDEYCMNINFK